jgi:membrane-bound ClpP family serine protease
MMDALFWSVILLVVGIGLVAMELFLPSGGVLSLLAALAIAASVTVAFTGGITAGAIMLTVTLIVLPLILAAAVRWWPYTPLGRLMVLHAPEHEADVLPDTPDYLERQSLIGRRGVAKTKMLPSGAVVIDGRTYDALSDGTAIDRGQPVRVKAVRTNRIVVVLAPPGPSEEIAEITDVLDEPADKFGLESLEEPPA